MNRPASLGICRDRAGRLATGFTREQHLLACSPLLDVATAVPGEALAESGRDRIGEGGPVSSRPHIEGERLPNRRAPGHFGTASVGPDSGAALFRAATRRIGPFESRYANLAAVVGWFCV